MIAGLRSAAVLALVVLLLLLIAGLFALSIAMKPERWSDRPRSAGLSS